MLASYLMFFFSLSLFAQSAPDIKVLPVPESAEDFEHQFKGCPENSECDQVMGLQLQRWKDLTSKLKDELNKTKIALELEQFRAKYGLPVEFYTYKKSQQGFKPLYFNSPCKEHNLGKDDSKVLKGMAFIKFLSEEKSIVWRDQSQIEVPTEGLLIGQPVLAFYGDTPTRFRLPLEDQPLLIKNRELYVLKEEDGFFYVLKVSQIGEWKVVDFDMTQLSKLEEKRQNVACPSEKSAPKEKSTVFKVEFCKTVWDEDLKKAIVTKMHQGCII